MIIPDLEKFLPSYAMTFVINNKFEIADTQFFYSTEITKIKLTETVGLKTRKLNSKTR